METAIARRLNKVTENLKKDLWISKRGNKDKISVNGSIILVEVPKDEVFKKSFMELGYILLYSFYKMNVQDVSITVTNGLEENYITT
jgi:hypothetical protein